MFSKQSPYLIFCLFSILCIGTGFLFFLIRPELSQAQNSSSDAIAVRITPNLEHYSSIAWYKAQNFKGSPQQIIVDGLVGVRDGRTAYVNVPNVDLAHQTFFTNIYIISYNQQAESTTVDIFSRLLANWRFSSNLSGSGVCRNNPTQKCVYDSECGENDFCDSGKARLFRDLTRASDIVNIKKALTDYAISGDFPKLTAGTYLTGKSLSVWPSWRNTFSKDLKYSLPIDPVNKIGACGNSRFNPDTCWSDKDKLFATTLPTLPQNSLAYYYAYNNKNSYDVCAVFESQYAIDPPVVDTSFCPKICLDFDGDGYGVNCARGQDCNDGDSKINPGATEICGNGIDENCNGTDLVCPNVCADNDGDGYDTCDPDSNNMPHDNQLADCDDADPSIHPGAEEVCDEIDNNCTDGIDEGCDSDKDGYCSISKTIFPGISLAACRKTDTATPGTIAATKDCNDANSTVYPRATELCDGIDNNCDGVIDEGCNKDGDTYCDCAMKIVEGSDLSQVCPGTNTSNPWWISHSCDCNDIPPAGTSVHPGANESCDKVDNNCNDSIDEGCACTDNDTQICGINRGVCRQGSQTCVNGAWGSCVGEVRSSSEICDGLDNNCNGQIDEGFNTTWYLDADGDSYGDPNHSMVSCTQPPGYVANRDDCNDIPGVGASIHPGVQEVCNGIDDDCDGHVDNNLGQAPALTGSEYTNSVCHGRTKTCDSITAKDWVDNYSGIVGYQAIETLCDGRDNDCDGSVDENAMTTFYRDQDGDGFGNSSNAIQACSAPAGYVAQGGDCDDNNPSIHTQTTYYQDHDGDGHGNPSVSLQACAQPAGYVTSHDDCNDNDQYIYLGADETCDGKDNDCNPATDEKQICDADNDGYCASGQMVYNARISTCPNTTAASVASHGGHGDDCNDDPAAGGFAIHPDATEDCNGVDDNCNNQIDEGFDPEQCQFKCEAGRDANNIAWKWFPGATNYCCGNIAGEHLTGLNNEFDCTDSLNCCGDGIDNNCDGKIDWDGKNGTAPDSSCIGANKCAFPITFPCDLF